MKYATTLTDWFYTHKYLQAYYKKFIVAASKHTYSILIEHITKSLLWLQVNIHTVY